MATKSFGLDGLVFPPLLFNCLCGSCYTMWSRDGTPCFIWSDVCAKCVRYVNYIFVSTLLTQFNYQAVDHFLALPLNRDLAKHQLTDMEWSVLSDVQVVLEVWAGPKIDRQNLTQWNRSLIESNKWCPVIPIQFLQAQSPLLKNLWLHGSALLRSTKDSNHGSTLVLIGRPPIICKWITPMPM